MLIFWRRCLSVVLLVCGGAFTTLAFADRTSPPRVGFIWVQEQAVVAPYHLGWVSGLRELGYVDGQNVLFIARYANGDESRLPGLVEELVHIPVDILVVSSKAIRPALKATSTIPIVCATMNDPVSEGLITSLGRPDRNLTGVSWQAPDTATKRLELALELRPRLTHLALLYDSNDKVAQRERDIVSSAARGAHIKVVPLDVHGLADIQAAFATLGKSRPQALHVVQTAIIAGTRTEIAALAIGLRLPMISGERTLAESGALLTYGPKLALVLKRGALYVDRLLKGARPQDLPIEQPTEFELVVNLKTATAIGMKIPDSILSRADYIIR